MATLSIEDYSLEIAYRSFEYGWVYYDIWVRWRGDFIINDTILKRDHGSWQDRPKGAFQACEFQGCGVLPLLRRVIETHKSDFWQSTNPDIQLSINTDIDDYFLILGEHRKPIWEAPHIIAEREARERLRAAKGPLPDDLVQLVLFIDLFNLANADAYYGDGPGFKFTTTRANLMTFYERLRAEYIAFADREGIDAFNKAEYGPSFPDPWF